MNPGVLQTHTATEQWQSFEIRMRRRRVERCVLRASVAIEAGVLEDARAALEEVQRLDPYEPALETLRTQLISAETNISPAGLLAAHSEGLLAADSEGLLAADSAGMLAASTAGALPLDIPVLEAPVPLEEPQPRHVWR